MFVNGLYLIEVALTENNNESQTLNKERKKTERVHLGQVDQTPYQRHYRWQQSLFFTQACINIVARSNVSCNMSHGVPHEVYVCREQCASLPSTAMLGLSVYLSVVSAGLSHPSAGDTKCV